MTSYKLLQIICYVELIQHYANKIVYIRHFAFFCRLEDYRSRNRDLYICIRIAEY